MPPHRGGYPSPGELGVRKDAQRAGGSYLVGDSTGFSHQSDSILGSGPEVLRDFGRHDDPELDAEPEHEEETPVTAPADCPRDGAPSEARSSRYVRRIPNEPLLRRPREAGEQREADYDNQRDPMRSRVARKQRDRDRRKTQSPHRSLPLSPVIPKIAERGEWQTSELGIRRREHARHCRCPAIGQLSSARARLSRCVGGVSCSARGGISWKRWEEACCPWWGSRRWRCSALSSG